MADNTQLLNVLAAHSMIVHPDVQSHGALSVASWLSGTVYLYHANLETTANADGVTYRIQGRGDTSGDQGPNWVDLVALVTGTTAAVQRGLTATEAAGEEALAVDSDPTASFTVGLSVYVRDTNAGSPSSASGSLSSPETLSEWQSLNTSSAGPDIVTLVDEGLEDQKDSSDEILTQAEVFAVHMEDLGGISQLRLLVEHRGATGSNIHYKAAFLAATDIE
jgi:hypothetical protein